MKMRSVFLPGAGKLFYVWFSDRNSLFCQMFSIETRIITLEEMRLRNSDDGGRGSGLSLSKNPGGFYIRSRRIITDWSGIVREIFPYVKSICFLAITIIRPQA